MQPFLQNSNIAHTLQFDEVPKYLEILADNDIVLRESRTSGYEVPRPTHISDQNLTNINKISCAKGRRKCSLPSETPLQECLMAEAKQFNGKAYGKRSSISSLNLSDRRGPSVTGMPDKSDTLDIKAARKRNSFSSLKDQRKYKASLNERGDSEASLEDRSCSSLSLAPSTRPSSSLINSQTVPLAKNNVASAVGNGEVLSNESAVTKSTLPKVQRTHSNLQNGKANIPLVINNALLNLLRQTPVVDDGNNIVTYTNISTDAVRVNGS